MWETRVLTKVQMIARTEKTMANFPDEKALQNKVISNLSCHFSRSVVSAEVRRTIQAGAEHVVGKEKEARMPGT